MNEWNEELCRNKEVWLLDLEDEAHMVNSCTWHFPAEPPSVRPFIGRLGRVANPPNPDSLDPDIRAKAQMLKEWREEGIKWKSPAGSGCRGAASHTLRFSLRQSLRPRLLGPASRPFLGFLVGLLYLVAGHRPAC